MTPGLNYPLEFGGLANQHTTGHRAPPPSQNLLVTNSASGGRVLTVDGCWEGLTHVDPGQCAAATSSWLPWLCPVQKTACQSLLRIVDAHVLGSSHPLFHNVP